MGGTHHNEGKFTVYRPSSVVIYMRVKNNEYQQRFFRHQ
jgi:hypothetical protein